MAVNLSPIGNAQQFFDNNGIPLSGGLLYTYQAGSSTALTTYTDINGSIPNSNPIVMDAAGRLSNEVWLTYGFNYKFVLQNSSGSVIGTYDNIYGIIGVLSSGSGTTIPSGLISIWYGSIGSVPAGWYLCDGANGTPDLRDRFVIGAGSTYSVGGTGGSASRTLTTNEMPSHTHVATSVVTDPGHFHSGAYLSGGQNTGSGVPPAVNTPNVQPTGTKTTGITVATTNATTGSGAAFNILNPYYALAYIMKS
jgi:microcystin-dependent protein